MQYTEDSICRPDIRIRQPQHGYRFALDSVLLARFLRTHPKEHLLEIGAGSGVITVLIAAWNAFATVTAVEIQQELAECCRANFRLNRITNGRVLEQDFRTAELPASSFDLIYTNPPYRKAGSGRLNPVEQKAIARHELRLNLTQLLDRAQILLKQSGRIALILPSFREADFHAERTRAGLHVREWKYVHSFGNERPAFFLATLGKTDCEVIQHAPWIIYDSPGVYTKEMNSILTTDGNEDPR